MTMKTVARIDRKPSRISRLARMRPGQLSLLVEAVTALASARLIIAARSPAQLMPRLGRVIADDLPADRPAPDVGDGDRAGQVSWAIRCAATNVPFRAMCLEQALAARAMLDRRNIAATVHYGVAAGADGGLIAHAWAHVAGQPITGYPLRRAFHEIARFASRRVEDSPRDAG
jgi:hypothetical protein